MKKVSMNVSTLAAAMTRRLFEISDRFEMWANVLENNLTHLPPSSSKCYQGLDVSKSVTDLKISIEGTTKCLLNEASKNAKFETDLTKNLNQYLTESIRGRKAMMLCGQAEPTAAISDCLDGITTGLQTARDGFRKAVGEIKSKAILRMRGRQSWERGCTSGPAKSIKNLENTLKMLEACQK